MVCDRYGWPLTFTLSPGQDSDTQHFIPTMEDVHLPGTLGRPLKRCRFIVADKGYDSDPLRRYCDRHRMKPVIAQRKMKRKPRPGAPRGFDKPRYRGRNIIERCFGWIKELRRVCTRYDKLASSFRAMVCLACIDRPMRQRSCQCALKAEHEERASHAVSVMREGPSDTPIRRCFQTTLSCWRQERWW